MKSIGLSKTSGRMFQILNQIYRMTFLARNMKLMYLDFYKGAGTFQYIYWNDNKLQEVSLAGYTTTEIIYTIIKICIINNPASRHRESESLYASNN
jgi:hypothetical protein